MPHLLPVDSVEERMYFAVDPLTTFGLNWPQKTHPVYKEQYTKGPPACLTAELGSSGRSRDFGQRDNNDSRGQPLEERAATVERSQKGAAADVCFGLAVGKESLVIP